MKALVFSPAAQADIEKIWDYSADNWGPDQADRYTDEIRDACQGIATGKKLGRIVGVRPDYLKTSTRSHVIFYRNREDGFEIIRILHVKQDVDRHL